MSIVNLLTFGLWLDLSQEIVWQQFMQLSIEVDILADGINLRFVVILLLLLLFSSLCLGLNGVKWKVKDKFRVHIVRQKRLIWEYMWQEEAHLGVAGSPRLSRCPRARSNLSLAFSCHSCCCGFSYSSFSIFLSLFSGFANYASRAFLCCILSCARTHC